MWHDRRANEPLNQCRALRSGQRRQGDTGRVRLAEDGPHHLGATGIGEKIQRNPNVIGFRRPRVKILRAISENQQQVRIGQGLDDGADDLLGGLVDPVHVFDDQHERLSTRDVEHESLERIHGSCADQIRRQRPESLVLDLISEQIVQVRFDERAIAAKVPQGRTDLLFGLRFTAGTVEREVLPHDLHER